MIIEIRHSGGYADALGHRVPMTQGGEAELKRRCLDTLAHYDNPPDEVQFLRPGRSLEPAPAAPPPASPVPAPTPLAGRQGPAGPSVAKAKDRKRG